MATISTTLVKFPNRRTGDRAWTNGMYDNQWVSDDFGNTARIIRSYLSGNDGVLEIDSPDPLQGTVFKISSNAKAYDVVLEALGRASYLIPDQAQTVFNMDHDSNRWRFYVNKGTKMRAKVRANNAITTASNELLSGWIYSDTIIAGDIPPIHLDTIATPTIIPASYGALLSWTHPSDISQLSRYVIKYTVGADQNTTSTPSMGSDGLGKTLWAGTDKRIEIPAPAFVYLKAAIYAVNRAGKYGKPALVGGFTGTSRIEDLDATELITMDFYLTADDSTENSRIRKLRMPNSRLITSFYANVTQFTDRTGGGPQKIRLYDNIENAQDLPSITDIGDYNPSARFNISVSADSYLTISFWNPDWNNTPPSVFPALRGTISIIARKNTRIGGVNDLTSLE